MPGACRPARRHSVGFRCRPGRPQAGQRECDAALQIQPGRFPGLYGAARSAEQIGDKEKARHYYAKLAEQTAKADGSRSELAQLREYRAPKGAATQPRSATEPRK